MPSDVTCAGAQGPQCASNLYGYPYPNAPDCNETTGANCVLDKWDFYQGQCTSWVAHRLNQLNGVPFSDSYAGKGQWGDAVNWSAHAQSLGIPVNGTPAPGSVAWYSSDHVAYVEAVTSPTSIVISEMNYDFHNGFRVHTVTTSSGWPSAFIHIHDLSSGPPTTTPDQSMALLGQWNRFYNGRDHDAITGVPASGYHFESTLGDLYSTQVSGTRPLYSCENAGWDEFTSQSSTCEGQHVNGLLGYIYSSKPVGIPTRGIYRCTVKSSGDHFDSPASNCEGQNVEARLGYAVERVVPVVPPTNASLPAITGTAQVGSTLTCSNGSWSNSPTSYTKSWLRDGSAVSGATASTYKLVSADADHHLSCKVTASNPGGSASATSASLLVKAASAGGSGSTGGGGSTCVVPKLKGRKLARAESLLLAHHCHPGRVRRRHSSTVKKGRVISTKPKAGAHRKANTKVALLVSRGRTNRR